MIKLKTFNNGKNVIYAGEYYYYLFVKYVAMYLRVKCKVQ